jgi:helicase
MYIDELDIDPNFKEELQLLGYKVLWPPQEKAIKAGALDGKNLVLCTPTASGKTLLAMLVAGKHVLELNGKAAYITPLRALANEKYEEFKIFQRLKGRKRPRVLISTGDFDSPSGYLTKGDLLVLTNEKFDSLLRHSANWLKDVTLFIFDEVHLLSDEKRGRILEYSITRVLKEWPKAQILALSATISNSKEISKWLNAKVIDSDWRPVRLKEGVYCAGHIFYSDGSVRTLSRISGNPLTDLTMNYLEEEGQVLIFADTRRRAVSIAKKLKDYVGKTLKARERIYLAKVSDDQRLREEETSLSKELRHCIKNGTAFHHAGLSYTHRKVIEDAFRSGHIKVIIATPTLAAGVNLPARAVIIPSPFHHRSGSFGERITVMEYKQMVGRAGRPGFDEEGEAILVTRDEFFVEHLLDLYINGVPEPITSQLDRQGLSTFVLAYIVGKGSASYEELQEFFKRTFLVNQKGIRRIIVQIVEALHFLTKNELLKKMRKNIWTPTRLGRRISTLYITPETGLALKNGLKIILESSNREASTLFLLTSTQDFEPKFSGRRKDEEKFMEIITDMVPSLGVYHDSLRSFLALYGWINEWDEERILQSFGVEPGDLYRMVESAEWLCYSLIEIAKIVGVTEILDTLERLRKRIKYGVKEELLELMRLEGVGRIRGRILYNAGYEHITDITLSSEKDIAKLPKIGRTMAKKILLEAMRKGDTL